MISLRRPMMSEKHRPGHHAREREAENQAESVRRELKLLRDAARHDGHRRDVESIEHIQEEAQPNDENLLTADLAVVDDVGDDISGWCGGRGSGGLQALGMAFAHAANMRRRSVKREILVEILNG
jgi:hypothetical protein